MILWMRCLETNIKVIMGFRYTEFNKIKTRLQNFEVVPKVDEKFPVSEAWDPAPLDLVYGPVKWPHIKDGDRIFANSSGWLFGLISSEVRKNLSLPIGDNEKIEYLIEIRDFYKKIADRITESDEGVFHTDLFTIDYSEYEQEGAFNPRPTIQSFINKISNRCLELIRYLDDSIATLKLQSSTVELDTIISGGANSFSLNREKGIVYDGKISTVFQKLYDYGFLVNKEDKQSFKNLFSNKGVQEPITWKDSNGLLHYFIDRLAEMKIIQTDKQIDWSVVQNAFYKKEVGIRYNLSSLNAAKPLDAAERKREKIDEIIAFLKS